MKNVLVIGGSGFVSGVVAHRAVLDGHRVSAVTRGRRQLPAGVIAIEADRRDRSAFEAAVTVASDGARWDVVIDCIGFTPEDAEQDIRVLGPLTEHIVFVSTDFVYMPGGRSVPQPERAESYNPRGYGADKRRCEEILLASSRTPVSIFRPCHIYGPGSKLGCLPDHGRDELLLSRLDCREPIRLVGGGYFLQQPVYVADLAEVLLAAAGDPKAYGCVANVAGPDIVRSRDYYEVVASHIERRAIFADIPRDEYLRSNPERESFLDHRVYDLTRLREIGLPEPTTTLSNGLDRHVDYLRHGGRRRHWEAT